MAIKLESSLLTMLLGDACEASGGVGLGTAERAQACRICTVAWSIIDHSVHYYRRCVEIF